MRGTERQQSGMFSYLSPEERVPERHPLRAIRKMTDEVLDGMSAKFKELYWATGRPSNHVGLHMFYRLLVATMLISAAAFPAAKKRVWQSGYIDPVEQVSVYHSAKGIGTVTIPLVIHAATFVYKAQEEAAVPYSEARGDLSGGVAIEQLYLGSPGSLLPWLGEMAGPVIFAVQGKTLYYLDHRSKEHKAHVIARTTDH